MRRFALCCSLAAGLLGACGPHVLTTPVPAPDAGARVRFRTKTASGGYVLGRLVSVGPDSVVFERRVPVERGGVEWVPASLETDSIAQLQVRVGQRRNVGRGALIGGAIGLGLGIACANEDSDWVTDEACIATYGLLGLGTGSLIGALVRTDVWAPTTLPPRSERPAPVVSVAPTRLGVRIPIRLLH